MCSWGGGAGGWGWLARDEAGRSAPRRMGSESPNGEEVLLSKTNRWFPFITQRGHPQQMPHPNVGLDPTLSP